jgi:hypothetical protein
MVQIDDSKRVVKAFSGRLSYHEFSAAAAHADMLTSPYADGAKAQGASKPYANILLTETQYERIEKFLEDEFFPECNKIFKQDPAAKLAASKKETDSLLEQIQEGERSPYNTPFSLPNEKTLALWPEAHRSIKCVGRLGVDLIQKAIVHSEDDLAKVKDPVTGDLVPINNRIIAKPQILDITETDKELYSGCWVSTQMEFWLYRVGKTPGLRADITTVIFAKDDTRFGGGVPIDEDAIFAELD